MDCQTHEAVPTLDIIITKEKDNVYISDPVKKFVLDHLFIHSYISKNRSKVVTNKNKKNKIAYGLQAQPFNDFILGCSPKCEQKIANTHPNKCKH